MGFEVALHTAGIHPPRLEQVLPLVDWVGMDVKTEFHRYAALTGVPGSGERARQSMELILASGVAHEFRTTVHPALLPPAVLDRLADTLAAGGVRQYVLQEFRSHGCGDPALRNDRRTRYLDAALHREFASRFKAFSIRWS